MEFAFYICGLIAILATLRVVTHTNPVHALLYLIISLLAIAGVFFSLGAYFAGALEIIVYAGAIMVLFVFVVMMLNFGRHRDRTGAQVAAAGDLDWPGHPLRGAAGGYRLRHLGINDRGIDGAAINAKEVGIALFGPYVGGGAGLHAAAGGPGGCLPHWPRRARRRGAEQPSERQRQTKNGGTRMIPLTHGLILAAILFVLGLTGLVIRRNLLFMLISTEIMINAAALAFVVAGSYWGQADGQIMYILAISLAAAEASIGLALLLQLHRRRQNLNIDSVSELRG